MEKQFDNTIVLFENEYYTEGGKNPKFKGKMTVGGVDKEFALWEKEKDGKYFYSGKVSDPYVKPNRTNNSDLHAKGRDFVEKTYKEDPMPDDSLPF